MNEEHVAPPKYDSSEASATLARWRFEQVPETEGDKPLKAAHALVAAVVEAAKKVGIQAARVLDAPAFSVPRKVRVSVLMYADAKHGVVLHHQNAKLDLVEYEKKAPIAFDPTEGRFVGDVVGRDPATGVERRRDATACVADLLVAALGADV